MLLVRSASLGIASITAFGECGANSLRRCQRIRASRGPSFCATASSAARRYSSSPSETRPDRQRNSAPVAVSTGLSCALGVSRTARSRDCSASFSRPRSARATARLLCAAASCGSVSIALSRKANASIGSLSAVSAMKLPRTSGRVDVGSKLLHCRHLRQASSQSPLSRANSACASRASCRRFTTAETSGPKVALAAHCACAIAFSVGALMLWSINRLARLRFPSLATRPAKAPFSSLVCQGWKRSAAATSRARFAKSDCRPATSVSEISAAISQGSRFSFNERCTTCSAPSGSPVWTKKRADDLATNLLSGASASAAEMHRLAGLSWPRIV